MIKRFILPILIITSILMVISCDKNEDITDPGIQTTSPKIDSITATKMMIAFGGQDPTIITVYAHGGSLTYNWEVDLGDIIPQNQDASIVSFTGSPCCIGPKEIKCTAANDKGSDSKIIEITIVE